VTERWFRLYEDVVNDPKLQRLPAKLFKNLINLWCISSANDGLLPSIKDIAFKLRLTEAKVQEVIDKLRAAGLIDETDEGLQPHNWNGRQFKTDVEDPTAAERMRRYRDRKRNGVTLKSVTVTVPRDRDRDRADYSEPNGSDADASPATEEKELFRRGKAVLGKDAGGLIAKLLKAKDGNVALARAAIETASTKQNPREWIGGATHNKDPPTRSDWDGIL
jgi:hypothetical protein